MGKASRKKKKLIAEGQVDENRIVTYPKGAVTPEIKKGFQKPTSKATLLIIIIVLLLSSFAVYFNSLSNDFVYDDIYQVQKNPWMTNIRYIPDIFSKNVWGFRKDIHSTNYYRPVMHLVYMMNFHIFGLKPWGFHLINILFHAGISASVFMVASRLLRESQLSPSISYLAPAFIAALLFATHPIHTEAVTWVAGVPDLSFSFFYFLSFYFYIKSSGSDLRSKGTYILSVTSFFLAALSKEPALTLPLILIAYDYSFRRSELSSFTSLKKYIPYLIVAGVYFILRVHALGHFAPVKRHAELSTYEYFINIFPLFIQYLEKLILPIDLNAFYVLHPISSISEAKGILSFAITIGYVILIVVASRRNKLAFLGLLFIIIPLLPVLYIPALGHATFAERYLYISCFGFVLLLASLIQWARLKKTTSVTIITTLLLAIAGLYSWGTVSRNTAWRDNYSLFSDTVKKSPDANQPHNDLGVVLFNKGLIDDAIEQYQIASVLDPNFVDVHYNLGLAFFKKGWIDKAIEEYKIALKLDPEHVNTHNNIGWAFLQKQQTDEAIGHLQIALKLNPDLAEAHNNLGVAFFNKGWIDKAAEQFQVASKLDPDLADAHNNLGVIYKKSGALDKSIEEYQTAVRLNPDNPDYRGNLERAYEVKRLSR